MLILGKPYWINLERHDGHVPSWRSMCISTSKSHWMEETRKCVYSGGKGSEVSGKKGWVLMVGELICPSPWRSVTSLKGKPVRCMGHRAGNLISSETRKQLHHWLTVHWKSQKWERYVAGFCSTPWGCKKIPISRLTSRRIQNKLCKIIAIGESGCDTPNGLWI